MNKDTINWEKYRQKLNSFGELPHVEKKVIEEQFKDWIKGNSDFEDYKGDGEVLFALFRAGWLCRDIF